MQRGHRNQQSLFSEPPTGIVLCMSPDKKGRSEDLIVKRNELLASRYYFYTRIANKTLPKAYELMELEVFLTRRTMEDLIQKNWNLVKHFKNNHADTRFFKKKFPFLVWEVPS